jgi:septum site-determining protein MinC
MVDMQQDKRQAVNIKGIRDGLLITMGEGNWPELETTLLTILGERADFLKGAKVAMDVGNHILRAADMGRMRDVFSEQGIALWAVMSNSPVTEQNAQVLGLATRISTPRPERTIRPLDTNLAGETAIFVQRTIRSGFKVSHNGHVTIMGDVNPGGEIYAGGNVVVWGRLKGMAFAGMEGDEKAVICALEMEPMQIRIAGFALSQPTRKFKQEPEMAFIKNGRVVIEPWKSKR